MVVRQVSLIRSGPVGPLSLLRNQDGANSKKASFKDPYLVLPPKITAA